MKIIILTDYQGRFGSKYNSVPYRSGLDLDLLRKYISVENVKVEFQNFSNLNLKQISISDTIYIHDSIEDTNYLYKEYIEDIVYALELKNAKIYPGYKFLRSHNNKVFMEFLKQLVLDDSYNNLFFKHFGCYEEFNNTLQEIKYPIVLKGAQDAQGRRVRLLTQVSKTKTLIKNISQSKSYLLAIKEIIRTFIHSNYKKESQYRNKFILQQFIPKLKNDWKILIFGERYYILNRGIKKGDFRASGSKTNYKFGSQAEPPIGIFDFARDIFCFFKVPYISLDVAFDGMNYYLIEFQFVCFGSSTHLKSDCYYVKSNAEWKPISENLDLERLYADSISHFIKYNSLF